MKNISILLILPATFAANVNAATRYVIIGGTAAASAASATSWGAACEDLQAVINASNSGDEIRVAAGTYYPNRPANNLTYVEANNRDNAFVLKQGVEIYGATILEIV
jgi:hypothetical protein